MTGGVIVGPYVLAERVAVRGPLETYRAEPIDGGGELRVDRIDPRLTARRPDVQRIAEAAQRAGAVRHPNVGSPERLVYAHDAYYLARPWAPGRTLADLFDDAERLPTRRVPLELALYLVGEVLTAVEAIHGHEMAHGALSAEQVAVGVDGTVRVDGAVVLAAIEPSAPVRAPEGVLSRQADLFAVGELAYRALTGRRPFDGGNYAATRALMREAERVRPSLFVPSLPPGLDALVLALVAPDPERRPRTAAHALAMLLAAASGRVLAPGSVAVRRALDAVPAAGRPVSSAPDARRRMASYAGRALAMGDDGTVPPDGALSLVPREELQWDPSTREFVHLFTPAPPAQPGALEREPLLLITRADGQSERVETLAHLAQAWRAPGPRPRLVALPGTSWLEADRFAALAGLDGLADDPAPLSTVTHVGDLAHDSLITLLAELGKTSASGRLMIMDPAEPHTSRRVVVFSQGTIVDLRSNHPAHVLPDWLLRAGHARPSELGSLFREVLRHEETLVERAALRRRVEPARLWALAWADRLAEPLCTRRGRYAFDATPVPVSGRAPPLEVSAFLLDAARRAKTPEELRQWAAPRRSATYAMASQFAPWCETLSFDSRLCNLSRELARHGTLEETIRRVPGDAGAVLLLAYLFHETRALVFKGGVGP